MHLTYLILGILTFVELNCENLFDARKDSVKDDTEYTAESLRHWTRTRYWNKLNSIAQEIISCGDDNSGWALPDLVALCEVENDTVLTDLSRRSLLRNAGYEYVITDSPDQRGIDVALLYSPFSFRLINHYPLRIPPMKEMRPTRDILYACGELINGDTRSAEKGLPVHIVWLWLTDYVRLSTPSVPAHQRQVSWWQATSTTLTTVKRLKSFANTS